MANRASPTDAIFPDADWVSGILLGLAARSSRGADQAATVKHRRNNVARVHTARVFMVPGPPNRNSLGTSLVARSRPKVASLCNAMKVRQLDKLEGVIAGLQLPGPLMPVQILLA